ncbi:MAG: hypothetical protein JO316_02420 [Abitibacteriaceae bacterium]|nr:hypothetical protein [Abditibacteriaceae bacterium]MBV9864183.1 hypothetical protein [Abditibacteriaceae bacterium]
MIRFLLFFTLLLNLHLASAAFFTDAERTRIVTYWNAPGRYRVDARAEAAKSGPWVVRLTPEASQWLYNYGHINSADKIPPTANGKPTTPHTEEWEKWITAKLSYDQWLAQTIADAANAQNGITPATNSPAPAPPLPGMIPDTLLAAVGNPPPLAAPVTPLRHTITFEDGDVLTYTDHIPVRARFAYYRFAQGVMHPGVALSKMSDAELDALFAESGMTPFEQHVAKSVSRLEGGFESVNTYDTGYLSVGFIQFATLAGGAGSLGDTLKKEKTGRPNDFQADFRNYGLDVNDKSELVVLDPVTGAELVGATAVQKIIDDKRLVAVFQHAGTHSHAFRVAQIQTAKQNYYPADNPLKVTVGNQTITGKVSDVIKSEAGMATLFDRKVNTGSIRVLATTVEKIMADHHLTRFAEVAPYEREIIKAVRWRTDFLQYAGLSQPA